MRKFISRAAALLLAGVMTAAVAGCGKNSDSKAKDTAKKWTELDHTDNRSHGAWLELRQSA